MTADEGGEAWRRSKLTVAEKHGKSIHLVKWLTVVSTANIDRVKDDHPENMTLVLYIQMLNMDLLRRRSPTPAPSLRSLIRLGNSFPAR